MLPIKKVKTPPKQTKLQAQQKFKLLNLSFIQDKINNKPSKDDYLYFNVVKDVIKKYNIIINEFGFKIIIIKCKNYFSLKYLIENMQEFYSSEIEIFVYNDEYYASMKFNSKSSKENIINVIKEFKLRENEFELLNLYEIMCLVCNKVYKDTKVKRSEVHNILNDKKNYKMLYQKLLFAKNVVIKNDYISFSKNKTIKHQIIGLQMYPSFLYEGFLSEINYIENVETTTYIKSIDLNLIKESIKDSIEYDELINEFSNLKKLFNTCFYIHIWGNNTELIEKKELIIKLANKYHVILNEFTMQQRRAYSAFLPFMNNNIKCYRAISNIDGILPYNEDIIKFFKNGFRYGTELISKKKLYYNRLISGVILSSNKETKRFFIQNERNFVVVNLRKTFRIIDFLKNEGKNESLDFFFNDNVECSFIEEDKYILFKMYVYLCLAEYKSNNEIEKNDKEVLNSIFNKIDDKIFDNDFSKVRDVFLMNLDKNKNLSKKILKNLTKPTERTVNNMNTLFDIYNSFNNEDAKYIYVYNIQEIINCLDIFFRDAFKRKTSSIYLYSSYNDFSILNNEYVIKEVLKAPYINILDINTNELIKINKYLNLPNDDIAHLKDQRNISGILYTDMCEYNYYIEREEDEDI